MCHKTATYTDRANIVREINSKRVGDDLTSLPNGEPAPFARSMSSQRSDSLTQKRAGTRPAHTGICRTADERADTLTGSALQIDSVDSG